MKAVHIGTVVSAAFSDAQFIALMRLVETGNIDLLESKERIHISNIKQDFKRSFHFATRV